MVVSVRRVVSRAPGEREGPGTEARGPGERRGVAMAPKARKRRSPGEGSVWPYRTKAGQLRYAIGYVRLMPDGTRKAVTGGPGRTAKSGRPTGMRSGRCGRS